MGAEEIVATLRRLPSLRTLPPDLLERVSAGCRLLELGAGEPVFLEGEPVRGFFIVRRGAIKVYRLTPDGREQVLHHLGEGHSFAEAAVLSMQRYPASAATTEAGTQLVEVAAQAFLEVFHSDRRMAAAMVSSLSMWLLGLVERVDELSVASAGARLARFLLRQPSHVEAGETRIVLPMAKKELAGHLAITPETLSRLLRRWQDRGIVRSEGRTLTVLDENLLAAVADREEEA